MSTDNDMPPIGAIIEWEGTSGTVYRCRVIPAPEGSKTYDDRFWCQDVLDNGELDPMDTPGTLIPDDVRIVSVPDYWNTF